MTHHDQIAYLEDLIRRMATALDIASEGHTGAHRPHVADLLREAKAAAGWKEEDA